METNLNGATGKASRNSTPLGSATSTTSNDWLKQANYAAKILIVDDHGPSLAGLARLLTQAGYQNCTVLADGSTAADQFFDLNPDLMLLDLHMEPVSGFVVLQEINRRIPAEARPPVLVLTADTTAESKHEALWLGATDFLSKPLDNIEVLLRISNLLTNRNLFRRCQLYSDSLQRLVDERTVDLQRKTTDLEKTLTELRETQWQLVQQERMRALGTMACGIAHDLNNGLTTILGYGDVLLNDRKKFPPGSQERKCLEEIVLAGSDNAKLVERLREFYRPSAPREHKESLDLNELVEQAIELTAPRWQTVANAGGGTIHIDKNLCEISPILGAPAELREVLTNLIFNAVDAMPNGGRLEFFTHQTGNNIRLTISDTGVGMTEETASKCLEPFFTTKGELGSGLGLAMSYGIIRRHGGSIGIESKPDQGSSFTISLPAFDEQNLSIDNPPETQTVERLRILVVDDHPIIQEIVSAYLAEDCHVVATASSASEALKKFQTDRFDLVITDHAMPETSGQELAARIKKIQPNEPIIMLTGFADLIKQPEGDSPDVDFVLNKPARLDDLRKAIFEVMCPG